MARIGGKGMTRERDRIYIDAINLFNKIKTNQSPKSKPLIWISEELYEEFKNKGVIEEINK